MASRLPPHTPEALVKPLKRLLRACDELSDAGAQVAISLCYFDRRGELTGVLVADPDTVEFAAPHMSPGVLIAEAGQR